MVEFVEMEFAAAYFIENGLGVLEAPGGAVGYRSAKRRSI
jgi:hypothetical protein